MSYFNLKICNPRSIITLILCLSILLLPPSPDRNTYGNAYAADKGYGSFTDIKQYEYALSLMEKGDYLSSAREFGRVIELFPSSPLIQDAQYNMGLSYLKGRQYRKALEQFKLYLKNFPQGTYIDEVVTKKEIASIRMKEEEGWTPLSSGQPLQVPSFRKPDPEPVSGQGLSEIPAPFLAIQVHILNGRNYEEVEEGIKSLKDKGYDVLILRVFHNKGDRFYPFVKPKAPSGVYFETSFSPVVEDILTPILKMAKRHGIKVFAWMTTRYADYGLEERKALKCKSYNFETNEVSYCRGLDLFNEDAVRHLEGLYRDLAKYPIDGILFQDDLILKHNEGFGEHASALFKKEMGLSLSPARLYRRVSHRGNGSYSAEYTEEFWKWAAWKNRYLLSVARRLMAASREVSPKLNFAINMMYESAYKPDKALAWLSQSLEEATKVGFDFYAIMAYHKQMQRELKIDFESTLGILSYIGEYASDKVKNPQKVLMKIQLVDWESSEEVTFKEIEEVIKQVSRKGVNIALTPYRRSFPLERVSALVKNGSQ